MVAVYDVDLPVSPRMKGCPVFPNDSSRRGGRPALSILSRNDDGRNDLDQLNLEREVLSGQRMVRVQRHVIAVYLGDRNDNRLLILKHDGQLLVDFDSISSGNSLRFTTTTISS